MPAVIAYSPMETPIGRLWLAGSDAGLFAVVRSDSADPLFGEGARRRRSEMRLDPDSLAEPIRQLHAYFAGKRRTFDMALDLAGLPPFDAAVYRAAMQIPYGETASYGELAGMAGSPRAARAVGSAMARCPLFPVVPCHRVIHADGSNRGWGPDLWIKRWLLNLERS